MKVQVLLPKNFNLPLIFVIEDNGKSVNSDTSKACGGKMELTYFKNKILHELPFASTQPAESMQATHCPSVMV